MTRRAYNYRSLTLAIFISVFGIRHCLADTVDLGEVRRTCSGLRTSESAAQGGTTTYKNLELSVTAGNTLKISEEGVLLKEVKDFSYANYAKCVTDLTTILSDINVSKKANDIAEKERASKEYSKIVVKHIRLREVDDKNQLPIDLDFIKLWPDFL